MHRRAILSQRLPRRGNFLSGLTRLLVPNVGTVIVVALLLFASRVGADPNPPATPTVSTPVPAAPEAAVISTSVISYQGRLTDNAGVPINGNLNLTFRLYDVSSGGSPLWTEIHPSVLVRDGVFQVLLGSRQPLPTNLFYEKDALYLGLSIGTGGELGPRERLTSVPFAAVAETLKPNAATAGNLTIGGILTVSGTDLELRGRGSGGTGRRGRALVDGGTGHGLLINFENDFGKVQISGNTNVWGDLAVSTNASVGGELRYSLWRQDNTANTLYANTRIQTGWGYIRGDDDKTEVNKTVTFPSSFSEPPVVLISSLGLDTDRPDSIDDFFGTVSREVVLATDVRSNSFKAVCARNDGSKFTHEYYYGFAWIAIGR